jgi:nitroreductase
VLLAAAPGIVLAAFQAAWPWPFFSDDAFISLRYAERLLAGEGLTWTDGERVEGYSNLLWVLACAALGGVGFDLVTAARLLGASCTAAATWCLAGAMRPKDLRSCLLAATAPILVASTQPVLAWTLGGLEGPMVMWWLAWGLGSLVRELAHSPIPTWNRATLLRCGVPFALLCLTRPDGPLWTAGAGIALGLAAWRSGVPAMTRQVWYFALLPIGAVLAQLAFRLAYYGELVPNTAHVKVDSDARAMAAGRDYVRSALFALQGIAWPALIGLVSMLVIARTRARALATGIPLALWLVYLVAIGGDHFPGRRLMQASLVPMALIVAVAASELGTTWRRLLVALALVAGGAAANLWSARTDAQSYEVRGEIWEWRGKVLGEVLAAAFAADQPRLAVDASGALPFYSRLPALDMLGLCDRTIAKTPAPDWLHTVKPGTPLPAGHLKGNGRYVMDQAPDLMLFAPPVGLPLPLFVSAAEFEDDPRFLRGYRCVLVDLGSCEVLPGRFEALTAPLWVRLEGKVGVRRSNDRIEIPAWLFGAYAMPEPLVRRHQPASTDAAAEARRASHLAATVQWFGGRGAVAVPSREGQLRLELRTHSAQLAFHLPAGHWRVEVEPVGTPAVVQAGPDVDPSGAVSVPEPGREVVATLRPADGKALPIAVERIVFVREH